MITTLLNTLFSLSLFVTGGHIVSTNLKLHHYSDDDYKEIFLLKNKASISRIALDILKWKILKKQDIVGIMVGKKRDIK